MDGGVRVTLLFIHVLYTPAMSYKTTTQNVVLAIVIGIGLSIPLGNVLNSITLRLLLGLAIGATIALAVEFTGRQSH
jgi:uncharacterized membrane protein